MTVDQVVQLVGSLGFPIVCCGALFWYLNKTMEKFSDKVEKSLGELSKSIASNTDATSKLVTTVEILMRIGGDSGG